MYMVDSDCLVCSHYCTNFPVLLKNILNTHTHIYICILLLISRGQGGQISQKQNLLPDLFDARAHDRERCNMILLMLVVRVALTWQK